MKPTDPLERAAGHRGARARARGRSGRPTGFASVSLIAIALPAVILVGALARSFQSSTARRFVGSAWMHYVGLEVAEGAVAEAAHFLRSSDLFDPAIFGHGGRRGGQRSDPGAVDAAGGVTDGGAIAGQDAGATAQDPAGEAAQDPAAGDEDPAGSLPGQAQVSTAQGAAAGLAGGPASVGASTATTGAGRPGGGHKGWGRALSHRLLRMMVADRLPALAPELKEYRSILTSDGSEAARMLVAFRFPPRDVVIATAGLARKLAAATPGVHLDGAEDLVVHARPLSFRREYYSSSSGAAVGRWVGWGVVQFRVKVRTDDLRGTTTQELVVDRRFTLKSGRPHHRRRDRDGGGNPDDAGKDDSGALGATGALPSTDVGNGPRPGEEVIVSNRDLRALVREVHS